MQLFKKFFIISLQAGVDNFHTMIWLCMLPLNLSAPNTPYDVLLNSLKLSQSVLIVNKLGVFCFSSQINFCVLSITLFSLSMNLFCVSKVRRIYILINQFVLKGLRKLLLVVTISCTLTYFLCAYQKSVKLHSSSYFLFIIVSVIWDSYFCDFLYHRRPL